MFRRRSITQGVRFVIESCETSLPAQDTANALDLLDHNEWGLALTLICEQLYEYDVRIKGELYNRIEQLGQLMELSPEEWTMLEELIE